MPSPISAISPENSCDGTAPVRRSPFFVCDGNSLIGPDIYDQGTLFGDEERDRINAFEWNSDAAGFGQIMRDGGFDRIIGNPPYIFITGMDETQRDTSVEGMPPGATGLTSTVSSSSKALTS